MLLETSEMIFSFLSKTIWATWGVLVLQLGRNSSLHPSSLSPIHSQVSKDPINLSGVVDLNTADGASVEIRQI